MNKIKLIRLVSGEEIVGTVKSGSFVDRFVIADPYIIVPTEERQIAIAPWMPYAQMNNVEIEYGKALFIVDLQKSLEDHYSQIVSGIVTKVQLPSKS